jgi:hypothetical protein
MDLVGMVVGLPLAPFRGLGALLEVLRDQAEAELYGGMQERTEQVDALVASGQITPEEGERRQEQVLEQVLGQPGVAGDSRQE